LISSKECGTASSFLFAEDYYHAGNGSQIYSADNGPATAAALNAPVDVVTDFSGNIYIADKI